MTGRTQAASRLSRVYAAQRETAKGNVTGRKVGSV